MANLRRYRHGYENGIEIRFKGADLWLYRGRSFNLDHVMQRQRLSPVSGYAQVAFGRVTSYGRPARRTLGLQLLSHG